jgi:HAMP domain-containing protein
VTLAAAGLLLALVLGLLWSWRVARPVERLAADSGRLARGDWDTPVEPSGIRELEALAGSLDHMRQDLREYRERLRVSERHAAWSQMARTVAHEVKNPLTPIAIAVADLKRSHELNRPEFPQILEQAVRIVGEEVESLKRLLDEFSEFRAAAGAAVRALPRRRAARRARDAARARRRAGAAEHRARRSGRHARGRSRPAAARAREPDQERARSGGWRGPCHGRGRGRRRRAGDRGRGLGPGASTRSSAPTCSCRATARRAASAASASPSSSAS